MRAIPQLVSAALNPIPVYSLPNFLTHGAPLRALRARESSAIKHWTASKSY